MRQRLARAEPLLAVLSGLVLLAVIVVAMRHAAGQSFGSVSDVDAPLQAGQTFASRHGNIYANPSYVYLPTSAVLFAGFPAMTLRHEFFTIGVVESLVFALGCVWTMRLLRLRNAWSLGLLAAAVALGSEAALVGVNRQLNLGTALVAFMVATMALWEAERWQAGTAVLVASALIKPVLVPLVLLPLVRKQVRPLVLPVLVGVVLAAVATALSPGGRHVLSLPRFLASGSTLTGDSAIYNLSIKAQAELHGVPHALSLAVRLAIFALAAYCLYRYGADREPRPLQPFITASALLAGFFLAGSLSETSYLVFYIPGLLVVLAKGSALTRGAAVVSVLIYALPDRLAGHGMLSFPHEQLRFLAAGGITFATFVAFLVLDVHRRGRSDAPRLLEDGRVQ